MWGGGGGGRGEDQISWYLKEISELAFPEAAKRERDRERS